LTLAIDGSVHHNSTASSQAVSLTTSNTNDYIIVCVTTNSGPVTSITGGGLSFSRIASNGVSNQVVEVWSAFASSTLSATSLTINTTASNFLTIDAFGVSGSNQTSTVFDSGGPQTGTDPISITTANPNTMVIAAYRELSAGNPTAGTSFTAVSGADFQLVEYKVLSSTATISCTQGTGAGSANGGVAFAIVQASGDTLFAQILL
jgi:hypothetical protein